MPDELSVRSKARQSPLPLPPGAHPGVNGKLSIPRTPQTVRQLLEPVQGGLRLVEKQMKTVESSVFAPLADAFVELIGSGGKRLRPGLALLTAQLETPIANWANQPQLTALAAAVEMLHTATLVHDDVIDGSLLRRGAPTLNASWSQGATVLAGDHMFARAALFAAQTDNSQVIHIFSNTLQIIVDGEMRQLFARNEYGQERENYYQRIYAKTASLFSAASEAAGVLVGFSRLQVAQLKEFGYHFGMAFQIMDDILDFTGDDRTLGKPAGSDLRQGTLTLPFLHYLRQQSDAPALVERLTSARLAAEAGEPEQLDQAVAEAVAAIRASGAIDAARDEAVDFLDRAEANLSSFPDSRIKEALVGLCSFVVHRSN
ncbi:MAG: polyprenyl synthetase family protein [Caldilineaceae bacterium]